MSASVRRPDFVVVGAPKCGTTSLHAFLRDQPDIFVAAKEPHFFARDVPLRQRLAESEYLDRFRDAGNARRIGDVSVWYLYSRTAATAIHDFCGPVRIIAVLRNPVDAMHSLHSQLVFNGDEPLQDFEEALAAEPERREGRQVSPRAWLGADCLCYRRVYSYAEQIERYQRVFGAARVHCILFEDLTRQPAVTCRNLLDFLDLDSHSLDRELRTPVELGRHNPNKTVRRPWLRSLHRRHERSLRRMAHVLLPRQIRQHLGPALVRRVKNLYTRVEDRPPMNQRLRADLAREMEPDVRRLEALIGRDLSAWRAFEKP